MMGMMGLCFGVVWFVCFREWCVFGVVGGERTPRSVNGPGRCFLKKGRETCARRRTTATNNLAV